MYILFCLKMINNSFLVIIIAVTEHFLDDTENKSVLSTLKINPLTAKSRYICRDSVYH